MSPAHHIAAFPRGCLGVDAMKSTSAAPSSRGVVPDLDLGEQWSVCSKAIYEGIKNLAIHV